MSLAARGLVVRHGPLVAVGGVDLDLAGGAVAAVIGRNGAGKSSLLWALQGSGPRSSGTVTVASRDGSPPLDPARIDARQRRRLVGLVPQTPGDLLYLETVAAECDEADRESAAARGTCSAHLADLAPGIPADRHPRDLSEGQRLALALAIQLTADPGVLLLDEPTRGLDHPAKSTLATTLRRLADRGHAVLLSTHDVEFVAEAADRLVVMAGGDVVADGPTAEVVVSSPAFAPQVAKVLRPARVLTVADVRRALPNRAGSG